MVAKVIDELPRLSFCLQRLHWQNPGIICTGSEIAGGLTVRLMVRAAMGQWPC